MSQTIDHCIVANAEFLEDVATFAKDNGVLSPEEGSRNATSTSTLPNRPKPKVTENEMDKLRSTLRQLHRDWSEEGREERDKAYLPILHVLEERQKTRNSPMKVLVPG